MESKLALLLSLLCFFHLSLSVSQWKSVMEMQDKVLGEIHWVVLLQLGVAIILPRVYLKAQKDSNLGNVCRMASRILMKLMEPMPMQEESTLVSDVTSSVPDETPQSDHRGPISLPDYSNLFGEEYQVTHDFWDPAYLNILDSAAVEEGIMHVLYACASQVCYLQA
ncbi:hypothetical protein ACS0TY_022751 [Phlomoides rotata]